MLYAVDGGVLTGVVDLDDSGTIDAGETNAFTLTVNTDGSWSFQLQGQLDHPDPTTEDNLQLDFSSIITAKDVRRRYRNWRARCVHHRCR